MKKTSLCEFVNLILYFLLWSGLIGFSYFVLEWQKLWQLALVGLLGMAPIGYFVLYLITPHTNEWIAGPIEKP